MWLRGVPFLAVRDILHGLDLSLGKRPLRSLAFVALGLLGGWIFYVPAHELLHATACVTSGGEVSRLEISSWYGGAFLSHVFPFVVVEDRTSHAGRLSGFDTKGRDLVYFATDLGPFVLTLFPGVLALRIAARRARPFFFGLALPLATGPFLSLTGDMYEMGSLAVSRLSLWSSPAVRCAFVGDDLFDVAPRVLSLPQAELSPALGLAGLLLATLLGIALAIGLYALGSLVADLLGEPPLEPPKSSAGPAEGRDGLAP